MQHLVLIKRHQSVLLAHLYEHIFCTYINKLFYKHGFFPYVDYSLKGTTYDSGLICVSIEFYNPSALELIKQIRTQKLVFSEENLSIATNQLLAELEEPIASTGYSAVKKELSYLDTEPWQDIDELNAIDTKFIRKNHQPFYLCEGDPLRARTLTFSVLINSNFMHSHRELLPLFRQIALTISFAVDNSLCALNGYYSNDPLFMNRKQKICATLNLEVANGNYSFVNLEEDLGTALETFNHLLKKKGLERLVNELQDLSHFSKSDLAPNTEKNHLDTGILLGSKGWKRIATKENLELLLNHMSVEVKFGREKVSAPLIAK